jgi:hypothetical protein
MLAWSRKDLAKQAGVQSSAVDDIESGRANQVPPETAQAIQAILDRAGVSVAADGTVAAPLPGLPAPVPPGGGPIRWVEAQDLSEWAGRREAQEDLPELLTRLIRAATGLAARLEFPSGASVQHEGWDGICDVDVETQYVPVGSSGWETTTQREGITAKAKDDYEKRCQDPRNRDPHHTTFVFVSLRPWDGKQEWERARQAEGRWANVRALDADDLVHWIELHPAVGHWLSVRMRRRPVSLRQLSEAWEEWVLSTQWPMTMDLTLAGRDEDAATVLKWLYGPAAALVVRADSSEEAIAFVHATIDQLPPERRLAYHSRCLVADTGDAARALKDSLSPLVVVLNEDDPGLAASLVRRGHHVYLPFGSAVGSPDDATILRRPSQKDFEDALLGMGLTRHEAERLTRDSGRSLSILRRRIPAAPTGRAPNWADPVHARSLLPALLAGGWDEGKDGDHNALEQLARRGYDAFAGQLARWVGVPDSPFRKAGTTWRIASPRDAWFLLAAHLTSGDLDTFTAVAVEVLSAPDPRFEMDSDERWLAAARDKIPEHPRSFGWASPRRWRS